MSMTTREQVASIHTFMNCVPPENILVMVGSVVEFGKYTLTH